MMMMMMITITITIWKIQPFSLMIFSAWNLHPEGIFQPRLMTPEGLSRNREYIPFFQHGMMIWLGTGRLRLAMEKQNTPVLAGWQFQMVFHVFHLERAYCNSFTKPSPMAYHK